MFDCICANEMPLKNALKPVVIRTTLSAHDTTERIAAEQFERDDLDPAQTALRGFLPDIQALRNYQQKEGSSCHTTN